MHYLHSTSDLKYIQYQDYNSITTFSERRILDDILYILFTNYNKFYTRIKLSEKSQALQENAVRFPFLDPSPSGPPSISPVWEQCCILDILVLDSRCSGVGFLRFWCLIPDIRILFSWCADVGPLIFWCWVPDILNVWFLIFWCCIPDCCWIPDVLMLVS